MDAPRLWAANVELTLACNMRCRHCGAGAGRPRPDELSLDELDTFFEALAALGGQEVCLLGGEPLLHPALEEAVRRAAAHDLDVVLITNGFLVDPERARRLAGLPRLSRIGVSLDGASPVVHDSLRRTKGAFVRAWAALRLLRDAGLEAGAITTVSRRNLGELPALRDLLRGEQLSWQLQIASGHGGSMDRADLVTPAEFYRLGRFIDRCRREIPLAELPVAGSHDVGYFSGCLGPTGELPGWSGCAAGLYTVGVTSDGRVKGCLSQDDSFVAGSLRERSLAEIWNDPGAFPRNRAFTPALLAGGCAGCVHGSVCRAGCSDVAVSATGSPYDNPYCFFRIEQAGQVPPLQEGDWY